MGVYHYYPQTSTMCLIVLALVTDDVTLGSATITGQSIGVASQSTGFNGMCSYIPHNQLTKLVFDKAKTVSSASDPST